MHAAETAPDPQCVSGDLGAVVAADVLRMPASDGEDLVQAGYGGICVDAVVNQVGQGLAGELVRTCRILITLPVAVTSKWESKRPHGVRRSARSRAAGVVEVPSWLFRLRRTEGARRSRSVVCGVEKPRSFTVHGVYRTLYPQPRCDGL